MDNDKVTKSFVILVVIFICSALFLYLCRAVLVPFVIAALLAYIISPLISKIMMLGFRRWVAVTLVVSVFCVIVAFLFMFVIPILNKDISLFIHKLPTYKQFINTFISDKYGFLCEKIPQLSQYNITDNLTSKLTDFVATETSKIPTYLVGIISALTIVIMIPIITFFMLLCYGKAEESFLQIIPSKYVSVFLSICYEVNFVLGGYIRGQLIEVVFIAVATSVVLFLFGVKYALIIGIISGMFNVIPYLGPTVAIVSGIIATAIQYKSIITVIEVFLVLELVQQLDGHVVQPLVVGSSVNLSPVLMIFALLAGANLGGIIGMLIAVPTFALIKKFSVDVMYYLKKSVTQNVN